MYLFPERALSEVFRAKYRDGLKVALSKANINPQPGLFEHMMLKNWVVDAKEPFADPKQAIEYLGRYTHRVAISNHRIVNVTEKEVTFRYKDYSQQGKQKLMTLDHCEFLRRFCMHILPPRFVKIRHYGILSSRRKTEYIPNPTDANGQKVPRTKLSWQQVCRQVLHFDPEKCPCCGFGKMVLIEIVDPRPPPSTDAFQLKFKVN
jgi:hypothetical protein